MTDELSREAKGLVDRARNAPGPTAAQRAALRERLGAGVPAPPRSPKPRRVPTPRPAKVPPWLGSPATMLGVASLGVIVAVGLAKLGPKPRSPAPAPKAEMAAPPFVVEAAAAPLRMAEDAGTSALALPARPRPASAPVKPGARVAPQKAPPSAAVEAPVVASPSAPAEPMVEPRPAAASTLEAELMALQTGLDGAKAERWSAVLGAVDAYRRDFPRGALHVEFGALEVLGLCGTGRVDEAQRGARRLAEGEAASNPAVQRLRRSCAAVVFAPP